MNNKTPIKINKPKKVFRSYNNVVIQTESKKVRKVKQGCCMGGKVQR